MRILDTTRTLRGQETHVSQITSHIRTAHFMAAAEKMVDQKVIRGRFLAGVQPQCYRHFRKQRMRGVAPCPWTFSPWVVPKFLGEASSFAPGPLSPAMSPASEGPRRPDLEGPHHSLGVRG